jgi:uroporphyrinogen decarboxylase
MNSEERLLAALQRKEPDRVPCFEWIIDKKVINAIHPGMTEEEFIYKMDIDAICVDPNYKKTPLEDGFLIDEWGVLQKYSGEGHSMPVKGCIETMADFKKYVAPDPHAPERFKSLDEAIIKHKGKKALIFHLNDVVTIPRNLLGYEPFLFNTLAEPELVRELVELSVDLNLELAKEVAKRGIKIVYTGDDFAFNDGPLFDPEIFRDIFYPGLCRVVKGYHDLGLIMMKHTDGNLWSIIDMIIDSGIDCLDPIDPQAGMRISEVKKKYGDRIAIKGNVDCAQTLTFGTPEQVIAETKQCLLDGAPGGGYIMSSGNSIHSGVKPENYIAMLDTVKKYGNYPISID